MSRLAELPWLTEAHRNAARDIAVRYQGSAVAVLIRKMHRPPVEPAAIRFPAAPLGTWLKMWHAAIFEVLYHLPDSAEPSVRAVAFGVYDWTQANAITTLCRWAAEGRQKDAIVSSILRGMPEMRPETIEYVAEDLHLRCEVNPQLQPIADVLCSNEVFRDAWHELLRPPAGAKAW